MTDRVLGVPLTYIGNSFKDIFKQRAALEYNENGNCFLLYKKTTLTLLKLSIIPFVLLFLFAPYLFSFVFGESWEKSGEYARILCLLYLFSFISMPTSWLFVIAEKQKLDLLWQVIFLILTLVALTVGYFTNSFTTMLIAFCTVRTLAFGIQIFFTYNLAKGNRGYGV